MRVCITAGGRFHIFDLARQMSRLGHLARLYTGYPRWKVDGLPSERVSVHPWLSAPTQFLARLNRPGFYDYLNRTAIKDFDRWVSERIEPCDVLHSLSSFATQTQLTARRKYGSLLVCERLSSHIVYQDEILAEEFHRWKRPYHPIDPEIVRRELQEYEQSDLIVVPSEFVRRSFVSKGVPAAKLRTVPFGVDLALFHPAPRTDHVFRVLFVGTLSLRKGIPDLLDAVSRLRLPNLELCLIGSLLPEVRPFLAAHEGEFRYLGVVARTRLYEFYSQGSVLVLPSLEEGLAFVQAQAMACGLPVISSSHSGGESLFTDGVEGFTVPIRDPDALAAKIRLLYDHPNLQRQMSQAALARVKQIGGWDSYGSNLSAVYKEALQERESAASAVESSAPASGLPEEARAPSAVPISPAPSRPTPPSVSRAPLPPLRVSVSVGGKFHAFHLAEQLAKRGWLGQFLTTYYNPRSNAWGVDVPRQLVTTNVLPELIARLPLLFMNEGPGHWYYRKGEQFDHWAARKLKPCDIFVGWSGFSLHTIARVREMGATVILVRGSAHILTQKQLMDEEIHRFGYGDSEVDRWTVEKELREYELADYIAMPSKFCERSFLERGLPKEKLRVWPLGADTRRFQPPAEERPDNPFRVLYVGEVSLRKGIYYLLDAFRRAALPNSELILVGNVKSNVLPMLRDQPPSVKAMGVIRFPALLNYYHRASAFVLPSVEDGFGQVVMQAMVTGLPVLVSSNAGASEAVREGENGFVFQARNVDALSTRLEQLYRDPELRRQMGRNALGSAFGYTWDNYGAAVEASLLEIAGRREVGLSA